MANVPLPANIYAGGAAKVDSTPFTHFYINMLQRRQIHEDAMARYFGDMGKGITPSGMHAKDIGGLMEMKNKWQSHIMQNRGAYYNPSTDNGKAYGEGMGMYNDMQAYMQASKDKVKDLQAVQRMYNTPEKRALMPDEVKADLAAAELPLNDPHYRPIDFTHLGYNPKPWDAKQEKEFVSTLGLYKPGYTDIGDAKLNPQTGLIDQKQQWNLKSILPAIEDEAIRKYHTDPAWKSAVDDSMVPHTGNYDTLNGIFKEQYGKDIQTPQEMSVAKAISLMPQQRENTVSRAKPRNLEDELKLISARGAQTRANQENAQKIKENATATKEGKTYVDKTKFWNGIEEGTKKEQAVFIGGDESKYWQRVPLTNKALTPFAYVAEGKKILPLGVYRSSNNEYKAIFAGNVAGTTSIKRLSQPITEEEFKRVVNDAEFGLKATNEPETNASPVEDDPQGLFKK